MKIKIYIYFNTKNITVFLIGKYLFIYVQFLKINMEY